MFQKTNFIERSTHKTVSPFTVEDSDNLIMGELEQRAEECDSSEVGDQAQCVEGDGILAVVVLVDACLCSVHCTFVLLKSNDFVSLRMSLILYLTRTNKKNN